MSLKRLFSIKTNENRIYGLDILRALAIMSVMWGHTTSFLPYSIRKYNDEITPDGVSIFFVLSGFLIGSILIKILEKEKISLNVLGNFWIRRWFRTLPNYLLILTILSLLSFQFNTNSDIWKYYFFIQNFISPHPLFFPEAWSLSIEEWFYLIIPILILITPGLLGFSKKTTSIVITVLFLIVPMIIRAYRYSYFRPVNLEQWDQFFRKEAITRLDSLMFGVIGSYLSYYYKEIWKAYKNNLLILGIFIFFIPKFICFPPIGFYNCVLSFSISSFGILLLLPFFSQIKKQKGYIYKLVTHISLISYSMYLINNSLIKFFIIQVLLRPALFHFINVSIIKIISYIIFWGLTITISTLLYKFFELPFIKVRNKITPKNIF